MYRILEALVRWLAPILSFTAEEIWQHMPKSTPSGPRGESVLFETWYDGLDALQGSAEQRKFWSDLLAIRAGAAKLLEGMRNAGQIGAALEAEVTVYSGVGDEFFKARLAPFQDELRFFFITSALKIKDVFDAPGGLPPIELEKEKVWVSAVRSEHKKCVRCWHYRADVGVIPEHPEICGRCVENLPGGPGEIRRYF